MNGNLDSTTIFKNQNTGTYSYTDDGGEQDVVEIADGERKVIHGVWLDLTNMTQNGTIKLYYKIDGSNYRQVSIDGTTQSYAFTVADAVDGVYIRINAGISNSFKITYEEGADEGAARDIVYELVYV